MGDVAECKNGPEVADLRTAIFCLLNAENKVTHPLIGKMMDIPFQGREYPTTGHHLALVFHLFDVFPEWRPRIGEMADQGVEWAAIVAHWDELDKLHRAAPPGGNFGQLNHRLADILGALPTVWP